MTNTEPESQKVSIEMDLEEPLPAGCQAYLAGDIGYMGDGLVYLDGDDWVAGPGL